MFVQHFGAQRIGGLNFTLGNENLCVSYIIQASEESFRHGAREQTEYHFP